MPWTESEETGRPWAAKSRVRVRAVRGESRLTSCLCFPPVKVFNPGSPGGTCQLYLAGYGGGLVQGDAPWVELDMGPGTRTFIGSQSSTKLYRSPEAGARQTYHGMVRADALAVVCQDPLVPFAGSRFFQRQEWTLETGAGLVLVDWVLPGREERGERFAFHAFESDLGVGYDGRRVLRERLSLRPQVHLPESPAHFAGFGSMLNIYWIGPGPAALAADLEKSVPQVFAADANVLAAVTRVRPELGVLRALARRRLDLEPIVTAVFEVLSGPRWLGFNPLLRRY